MRPLRDYEGYVIIVAPLLNSVSGIAIDLFAPSMPSIAATMHVSETVIQSSISITLVAYAIGQLAFGMIADGRGRLAALLPGLAIFFLASLLAMSSSSIETFLWARALQGFAVGACQVSARALLVDNVKGERFLVAVVYLSLAWGLGPVLAPFIGGEIEQYLGWRWNFAVYAAYSASLFLISLRLRESLMKDQRKSFVDSLRGYRSILSDSRFLSAVLVLGASLSLFLIWNIIGPFLVQQAFHRSAAFFGSTALAAGACYLVGTLLNRALIKVMLPQTIIIGGLAFAGAGAAALYIMPASLNLPLLLSAVLLSNFGQGLIFSNVVGFTMKLYVDRAGATASLLGCGMMAFSSVAATITGHVAMTRNLAVALIFTTLFLIQAFGVACIRNHRTVV